jgi:hypothetical protein
VVEEGVDLSFYPAPEEVQSNLEGIDVRNGLYVAYDADGRLLELTTDTPPPRKLFGKFLLIDQGKVSVIGR